MSELNCKSQTVFIGDNREVMRGLNSASVDLICADPPFNKKRRFNHNFGTPAAKAKKKAGFDDYWTMDDVRQEEHELLNECYPKLYHLCAAARNMHSPEMQSYLVMMAVRLIECHRLLAETGSLYLHCDPTANAYLRLLVDGIFGQQNFRNEIIWCYGKWSNVANCFQRNTDTILFYAKSQNSTFNVLREFSDDKKIKMAKGYITNTVRNAKSPTGRIRQLIVYDRAKASAAIQKGNYDNVVYAEGKGSPMRNWWHIPHLNSQAKERSGWATQKPLALYSRMILASSNPGDVVLDPFCGCATTLVAAENAGRQWIGIDREPEAAVQVQVQLTKLNENTADFWRDRIIIRHDIPTREDLVDIPHYRTHFSDLYTEQNGICKLCLEQYDSHVMEMDHIVARSKGGQSDKKNLQLLCTRCNKLKGNLSMAQAIAKAKKLGIRKTD